MDVTLGGFIDVQAKLRVGRIEQSDVDAVRDKAEDGMRFPPVWLVLRRRRRRRRPATA